MDSSKKQSEILAMIGGEGDYSYAHNIRTSGFVVNRISLPFLEDLVENCTVFTESVMRLADLGCASTESSFETVQFIVESFKRLCERNKTPLPDVQVFFNDLPSNDFNYVFRKLPPFLQAQSQSTGQQLPLCFSAGVPGSFYTRLFPANSLHFAYSSSALQWRSQVPAAVKDKDSKAWNKGHIFISTEAVAKAYLAQFNQDFLAFLGARGVEMVEGGRMFLLFPGRTSADIKDQGIPFIMFPDVLDALFRALVKEGLIEEEKLDSFNLPLFAPSVEEAKTAVEREGSFRIEKMEVVEWKAGYDITKTNESFENNLPGVNAMRCVFEKLFEANIGAESTKLLFERLVSEEGAELLKEKVRQAKSTPFFLATLLVKVRK